MGQCELGFFKPTYGAEVIRPDMNYIHLELESLIFKNMENKISKQDLRLGNMFEQGIVYKISGRTGAKVHLHGKGKWYKGFRMEVDVKELKPIALSPQVLVEWCGFASDGLSGHGGFLSLPIEDNNSRLRVCVDEKGWYGRNTNSEKIYFAGIHSLQNWYRFNTNGKELEIKE